jgi:ATP synthase F1 gamma subunit
MATLKEVQSKIVSVKKTRQITSAMKMVATSRLRGAQNSMEAFKPYASKFADVLGSIAGKSGEDASPLLVPRDEVKKVALILCTSDRGLCGGFNTNLITKADKLIKSELEGKDVSFIFPFLLLKVCLRDQQKKKRTKMTSFYRNISANLLLMHCLVKCCQRIFLFRYMMHCSRRQPVNMPLE